MVGTMENEPTSSPSLEMNYNEFLEVVREEFEAFMRIAESGRVTRHASLKARKQSIKIRNLLKDFRMIAIENDRRITRIMHQAKKQIRSCTE